MALWTFLAIHRTRPAVGAASVSEVYTRWQSWRFRWWKTIIIPGFSGFSAMYGVA